MSEAPVTIAEQLQSAMRLAPATVAVVTAHSKGDVNGLTATSFCSVSMDPPSMLVCVNQDSRTHALITESKVFCVNLLRSDQTGIANAFSSSKSGEEKIDAANTTIRDIDGLPVLDEASANMVCELVHAHDFGTHTVFIGTVSSVSVADDAKPLLYGLQSYGSFSKS